MFKQLDAHGSAQVFDGVRLPGPPVAQSGQLDALVALEEIGNHRSYGHDAEIYAEGDRADCWFKVVAGAVRICKLMADGRRHVAEFLFAGDCFGPDGIGERMFAAEAVGDVVLLRFSRSATERLLEDRPELTRRLCNMTLRNLTHAQARMLVLGRMTAAERVAHFLLKLAECRDASRFLDIPMFRNDIADYLGLAIETVCRVLSSLKRDGLITIPTPHRIELRDRDAFEAIGEASL